MDRCKGHRLDLVFSLRKSEDSCDRGSLFALPCKSLCSLLETEHESKIDKADDDMLLERINRVPVQMDHG